MLDEPPTCRPMNRSVPVAAPKRAGLVPEVAHVEVAAVGEVQLAVVLGDVQPAAGLRHALQLASTSACGMDWITWRQTVRS